MASLAGGRPGLSHGVACSAHPVGDILAELWNMPCPDLFPVTVFAIAFVVILVRPVIECDAVLEL
jgi:hypothetical protein